MTTKQWIVAAALLLLIAGAAWAGWIFPTMVLAFLGLYLFDDVIKSVLPSWLLSAGAWLLSEEVVGGIVLVIIGIVLPLVCLAVYEHSPNVMLLVTAGLGFIAGLLSTNVGQKLAVAAFYLGFFVGGLAALLWLIKTLWAWV